MKKLLTVLFILLPTCALLAQENYFYLNLDINTPLANTDWVSKTSGRGGKAGYRFMIGESRFSAGVDFAWAYFEEYAPTETFQNGNGAITTDYFKKLNQYSFAASGQYNWELGEQGLFFPYAGIGLGALHNQYIMAYNIYEDSDKGWGFLARPEAGILARFGKRRSMGAMAAVHFDYATNKSDDYNYSSYSAVGFQIGIFLMNR
jgi:hypothetical protein